MHDVLDGLELVRWKYFQYQLFGVMRFDADDFEVHNMRGGRLRRVWIILRWQLPPIPEFLMARAYMC
ncbi:hypothetical protein RSAG8_03513, partial [Rhizoctonia solani AG-8 WAC10335]